ncbi:MAG: OmpA family protein [Bacteroidales bacterium]|jgi:outer membrane protein OmpA-like peptidoglycan-associated protein|nr:OmpA family protein [Bacteroidales bacterium]
MKSFQYLSLLCCVFIMQTTTFGQNVEFKKKNFPGKKSEYKQAKKDLKKADKFFFEEYPIYSEALPLYLNVYKLNPKNAELNYKIGVCYVNSVNMPKAIPYLLQAEQLSPYVASDVLFLLATAYHADYQFDKSINTFRRHQSNLSPEEITRMARTIERRIEECKTGKELVADSVRAFIDNMGANINTGYSDYSPAITADLSMMVFTSKRTNPFNNKKDPVGEYDENIWVSSRLGSQWSQAEVMEKPINSKHNDATIGISPDGQKMFMYYGKKGGDIMYTERKGKSWTNPRFFKPINSDGHESAASFSYDGKTIYFVSNNSNKTVNYGQHDIYKCTLNVKDKWSDPINLGATINTPYDEVDVFMHPDGRTMFFSSDGHNTMGGYDVFRSELQDDGSWSTPENIGYPINTPGDERFFVLAGSGRVGYYSSSRVGGLGKHDVYEITFLGPEKKLEMATENLLIASQSQAVTQDVVIEKSVDIKTSRLTIVKGVVSDAFAETPTYLGAEIVITDNETGQVISTLQSNSSTGQFLIPLPSGKNYGIAVKKEGYLFHSENFNIPKTSDYQEIILNVKLMKIQKDSRIVLRNVFFDYGSAKLDPKSYTELDNLIKIMQDNPNMIIEIGGHTDNQGSHQFNQKLSEARAQSVVNYIAKSIPMSRLQYQGYAFDQPVADNCTDEGRALNRRVEFKIISNDE